MKIFILSSYHSVVNLFFRPVPVMSSSISSSNRKSNFSFSLVGALSCEHNKYATMKIVFWMVSKNKFVCEGWNSELPQD